MGSHIQVECGCALEPLMGQAPCWPATAAHRSIESRNEARLCQQPAGGGCATPGSKKHRAKSTRGTDSFWYLFRTDKTAGPTPAWQQTSLPTMIELEEMKQDIVLLPALFTASRELCTAPLIVQEASHTHIHTASCLATQNQTQRARVCKANRQPAL